MKPRIQVMWFRRDLRLTDNAALYHALRTGVPVLPIFIFDRNILDQLEDKTDRRVEFIHAALTEMQVQLASMGSSLAVYYGFPMDVYKQLTEVYVSKLFLPTTIMSLMPKKEMMLLLLSYNPKESVFKLLKIK